VFSFLYLLAFFLFDFPRDSLFSSSLKDVPPSSEDLLPVAGVADESELPFVFPMSLALDQAFFLLHLLRIKF